MSCPSFYKIFVSIVWALSAFTPVIFPTAATANVSEKTALVDQGTKENAKQQLQNADAVVFSDAESLFVGLYVNNRLQKEDTIYRQKNEFWIPFSLFLETTHLKESSRSGPIAHYQTTLGVINFNTGALKVLNSLPYISFTDLKNVFLTAPEFNQSLFAVMMNIPWNPGLPGKKIEDIADIKAPKSSISFIGIEAQSAYDFNKNIYKNLLLETSGRVIGGVWDITAQGNPGEGFTPTRYNWTTFNNNLALRLGTGNSGSYSLIGSTNLTGMQVGWNNHSILKQLDTEQSNASDVFLNLDSNQLRTIEGAGPPASIAELRFDGVVVARQRISLDGKFVFENVRMSTDLRKTEVYIYESSINEKPIKVIDYSQSISSRAQSKGELLIRGGVGKSGTLLSSLAGEIHTTTAFGNLLYGLNDRLTLEAATQDNPALGSADLLTGLIYTPGANWTTALYGARSNQNYGADARLEGHYKLWNTSYWGTLRKANFASTGQQKDINHLFRWSLNPFTGMGLQMIAHYEKQGGIVIHDYAMPAASLSPVSRVTLSATPDDNTSYRYDAGLRVGDHNTIHAIYQNKIATADIQRDFNEHLTVRVLNDYSISSRTNLSNLIIDWSPGHSKKDLIQTTMSRSGNAVGIGGSLTRQVNNGLRLAMQYSYNMNNATSLNMGNIVTGVITPEAQKSLAISLSWDLGWSNKGLFPINRNAVTLTRGAIAGSLDIANDTKLSSSDINNISILLNGRNMQQRQMDGSFFIGSLQPGVYRVTVDPEKLPIELVIDQKERKVEVKNGAVTGINIPVYAEFGIAGLVSDSTGNGIGNVMMIITGKDNKPVSQTLTNEFGYYRADALRNGSYQIMAQSLEGRPVPEAPKRAFIIKDNYLLDLNMTITVPPVPEPAPPVQAPETK